MGEALSGICIASYGYVRHRYIRTAEERVRDIVGCVPVLGRKKACMDDVCL